MTADFRNGVILYKQYFTPARITKEERCQRLHNIQEPTGMNSPVASIMNFDWAKATTPLCIFLGFSTMSGEIASDRSWIFSRIWKQALLATISLVAQILFLNHWNWSSYLWLHIFLEHDTGDRMLRDLAFDFDSPDQKCEKVQAIPQ